MAFEVKTTPEAEQDALDIFTWLMDQHAGDAGQRWFLKLDEAIRSLSELPKRCKIAPETGSFPFEVRELLYGQRPHVYRVLFTIETNIVYLLRLRHGRRLPLTHN